MSKALNIRIDEKRIEDLKKLAEDESKRTGYKITITDLIKRAIDDLLKRPKK